MRYLKYFVVLIVGAAIVAMVWVATEEKEVYGVYESAASEETVEGTVHETLRIPERAQVMDISAETLAEDGSSDSSTSFESEKTYLLHDSSRECEVVK